MGNPLPAITEAVREQLASWAPDSGLDLAALLGSLPDLLDALHNGLDRAVKAADPHEELSREVHADIEGVLLHLGRAQEVAEETVQTFGDMYAFWLGRD